MDKITLTRREFAETSAAVIAKFITVGVDAVETEEDAEIIAYVSEVMLRSHADLMTRLFDDKEDTWEVTDNE